MKHALRMHGCFFVGKTTQPITQSTLLGNGTTGNTISHTGTGNAQLITVYGKISVGQLPSPGSTLTISDTTWPFSNSKSKGWPNGVSWD